MQEIILETLSSKYPISPQVINASLVTNISLKDLKPVLAEMVEAGLIIRQGNQYLKRE